MVSLILQVDASIPYNAAINETCALCESRAQFFHFSFFA